MAWYQYRTGSSSGNDKWRFLFVADSYFSKKSSVKDRDETLARIFENDCNANTSSEHYRGVEWKKIDASKVPGEVVQDKLEHAKNRVAVEKANMKFYEEELKKCLVKEILVKCKYCKGKGKIKSANTISGFYDCHCCRTTGKVKPYDTW